MVAGLEGPSADESDATEQTNNVTQEQGSSVAEATFNFTNSVIGAGAIGLGGAMAASGGLVSVILILFFGCLTKISLDMVIRLSVETPGADGSYENLAYVGLGRTGRLVVMICKFLYSFGCLVAYIVVVKDNMPAALEDLIYGSSDYHSSSDWLHKILTENAYFTWLISTCLILPLCLLRDMTPLSSLSVVSVVSMVSIVGIVVYMYFFCPDIGVSGGSSYEKWLEIRPGILESLGTFVFTFVSQHTVHITFGSLKPSLRTVSNWKTVSSLSLGTATAVSLSVGVFVYMTFWQSTKSDIFEIYPQGWMIDLAKLLLAITMVLTFPLPFFTSRELLIITFIHPLCGVNHGGDSRLSSSGNGRSDYDLQQPLLEREDPEAQDEEEEASNDSIISDVASIATEISRRVVETVTPKNWLLPGDDRQLQLPGHIGLTVKLWVIVTLLAIAAPSLGDVLNLVGCATGTVIAFLLPALLSLKIEGYSHMAMVILCVGGIVGTVGTWFSLKKLVLDLKI